MMLGLVLGMVRFGIEFSYTVPPCGSGECRVHGTQQGSVRQRYIDRVHRYVVHTILQLIIPDLVQRFCELVQTVISWLIFQRSSRVTRPPRLAQNRYTINTTAEYIIHSQYVLSVIHLTD